MTRQQRPGFPVSGTQHSTWTTGTAGVRDHCLLQSCLLGICEIMSCSKARSQHEGETELPYLPPLHFHAQHLHSSAGQATRKK